MKKVAFIFVALLFIRLTTVSAQRLEKVEYLADSIAQKDDRYIRLLGGSSWILSTSSIALVTDDILIVFRDFEYQGKTVRIATAHMDGEEITVRHADGAYSASTGYLTTVVQALGDGAVLKLADGTLLSVPQYDRFDTGWWLPPYRVLLTSNGLYLYNLKEGKRVWVTSVK